MFLVGLTSFASTDSALSLTFLIRERSKFKILLGTMQERMWNMKIWGRNARRQMQRNFEAIEDHTGTLEIRSEEIMCMQLEKTAGSWLGRPSLPQTHSTRNNNNKQHHSLQTKVCIVARNTSISKAAVNINQKWSRFSNTFRLFVLESWTLETQLSS